MSGYVCQCGAYCNGKDPHPGEVDDLCVACWIGQAWGGLEA